MAIIIGMLHSTLGVLWTLTSLSHLSQNCCVSYKALKGFSSTHFSMHVSNTKIRVHTDSLRVKNKVNSYVTVCFGSY